VRKSDIHCASLFDLKQLLFVPVHCRGVQIIRASFFVFRRNIVYKTLRNGDGPRPTYQERMKWECRGETLRKIYHFMWRLECYILGEWLVELQSLGLSAV
jgi:hypothetical protein